MFGHSSIPFLDLAGNQVELGSRMSEALKQTFADLGLTLDSFVVENVSLPEELQKLLDTRIGMTMVGDMGKYTQFQVANSIPIAAANEGGGGVAGIGVGLGAGLAMGQTVMNAMKPGESGPAGPTGTVPPIGGAPAPGGAPTAGAPGAGAETKFCVNCGNKIPRPAKFCPECGGAQQ